MTEKNHEIRVFVWLKSRFQFSLNANLKIVIAIRWKFKFLKFFHQSVPDTHLLCVVQTQAISCLKSMSERGGSDKERL